MKYAALVTWLLTACFGVYLLVMWISHGGLAKRDTEESSRFAPALIFGHGGLAAAGLGIWIAYLSAGIQPLAWTTLSILALVATLGATMFGLWLRARRLQAYLPRHAYAYSGRHAAEDSFPPPAVLTHGLFAVTTVTLVLLTALS